MNKRTTPRKDIIDEGEEINLDDEEIYFDGERLTEARAVQISDEFADRVQQARRAGRPSIGSDPTRRGGSDRVSFRAAELRRRLDDVAAREGRSASEIARQALAEYLDRRVG